MNKFFPKELRVQCRIEGAYCGTGQETLLAEALAKELQTAVQQAEAEVRWPREMLKHFERGEFV